MEEISYQTTEMEASSLGPDNLTLNEQVNGDPSFSSSRVYLDRIGEVVLFLNSTGLYWEPADSLNNVSFFFLFFDF